MGANPGWGRPETDIRAGNGDSVLQRNQKPPPAAPPGCHKPAAAGLLYLDCTAPTGADGHDCIAFS
ncbi:hypothetical protein ZRA01_05350 [Zoogloea ramigera]|uniref:Uncharacterized protein n=1 Tax=Zoogloea ramigera TaxID=350 RepID=A0A4Y4CQY6_ZOORA|nr:hypothetical protein ZRA01_05350 [Zoogloea ramigera]